jgi:hypothetical protein
MEKKQYIIPTIETAEMEMDVVMQATSALLDETKEINSSEKIGSRELDEFIDWD